MRFFLILLLTTYLIIVIYKYFVGPFLEGLNTNSSSKSGTSSKGNVKVIYNPNDRHQSNKSVGEYVDYEEVKE